MDIHQHITDRIVSVIEAGAGEFRMPWHRGERHMRPINVASKKPYRGINILVLWLTSEERGYTSGTFGSYKQWSELGAQVRKGERSTMIAFFSQKEIEDEKTGKPKKVMWAKAYPVFAAEQVDGWDGAIKPDDQPTADPVATCDKADAFVKASKATIVHSGQRAFYDRNIDTIVLPARDRFIGSPTSTSTEAYYSTLLHELTHWTGAEARCNREFGKRFGDGAYAMEELVAELGAAFLCAELDITNEPRQDHAQYLAGWLKVLKADKKAIFAAASKASQAVDCLRSVYEISCKYPLTR